jgi:hypothetical protein
MSSVEMSSVEQKRPRAGGVPSTLLEIVVSIGGYYALRAVGVGVFWALTIPGIAVAVVAVVATVRRRRIDMIGLLVLVEVLASITLVLVTQDARIAAVREPIYVLISGAFCLVTLFFRQPFSHATSASVASFGDPLRAKAFELAWRDVARYRLVQRLLTASLGLILMVSAGIRAAIIYSFPIGRVAHAIDISNIVGIAMWVAVGVVSGVLVQPARRIVQEQFETLRAETTPART